LGLINRASLHTLRRSRWNCIVPVQSWLLLYL